MTTRPNITAPGTPVTVNGYLMGTAPMLLQEDLARLRMREAESTAVEQRLARRLDATNRWRRLAGWAARRAAKAASQL